MTYFQYRPKRRQDGLVRFRSAFRRVARAGICEPVIRMNRDLQLASNQAKPDGRFAIAWNPLPVFWYSGTTNFGDLLSVPIFRTLWQCSPVSVGKAFAGKALGVGSILQHATSGDFVWGAGLIQPQRVDGRNVKFGAVRGPRTKACIDGDVPDAFGDPASLLPLIYQPDLSRRRFDLGVVPHYVDADSMRVSDSSVLTINVQRRNWKRTVDEICSCDVIISSSLHGLVVAEAYGVPTVWVQPSRKIVGNEFKFCDYYEGTGRDARLVKWERNLIHVANAAQKASMIDLESLLSSIQVGRSHFGLSQA